MRFLIDTNVLSESMRRGDRRVMHRLAMHMGACAIAATTWHELNVGAALMPPGAKREEIDRYIRDLRSGDFPILPYDARAAELHAQAVQFITRRGGTLGVADGQIAAIAVANELVLATRNVRHFEHFPRLRIDNWFD